MNLIGAILLFLAENYAEGCGTAGGGGTAAGPGGGGGGPAGGGGGTFTPGNPEPIFQGLS